MSGPPLHGSCHCGQLTIALHSELPPETLPVRQCGCTFCLRHNPRYTSDPLGNVQVSCPPGVLRYRFGHGSADFVMCARCGVFTLALWAHEGRLYSVINLLVLDARARFVGAARLMDFDAETPAQRIARRAVSWTPTELVETG